MDKSDLQAISELLDVKLKPIQSDISQLQDGQKNINQRLDKIEKKMDAIYDQTVDLIEFKNETRDNLKIINEKLDDLKDVKQVTQVNCFEIAKLKAVK